MLTVLAATAAGTGGGTDLLKWALDQGGAFLVAIVCGYGWWRAERRADAERAARDVLAAAIMDRFVPALEKSTAGTAELIRYVSGQQPQGRREYRDGTGRAERRLNPFGEDHG